MGQCVHIVQNQLTLAASQDTEQGREGGEKIWRDKQAEDTQHRPLTVPALEPAVPTSITISYLCQEMKMSGSAG